VAADGVGSRVRGEYLPGAGIIDSGSRCVYGKTPLADETLARLPEAVRAGFTAIVGGHVGMAMAAMRFRVPPDQAAAKSGLGIDLNPLDDYLMWAVSARTERWPVSDAQLAALAPEDLHGVALTMIRSWHPSLKTLVRNAAPADCFPVWISESTPIEAWPPSPVTVLGDAIHAMSPARGSGANTALRDAAQLGGELAAAIRGEKSVLAAIGDYESEMRDYGYQAVEVSRKAEAAVVARRRSFMFWLATHLPRAPR
jgi:2-polyprenyl-6-methoxyphenol hydroxylase-like FAD-dependent oxidoreductase